MWWTGHTFIGWSGAQESAGAFFECMQDCCVVRLNRWHAPQVAAIVAIFLPLYESRDVFYRIVGIQDAKPQNTTLPTTGKGQFVTEDSAHTGANSAGLKA